MKKAKYGLLHYSRSFKVGINRKPVCNFLLVINANRHPISYRFGVTAAYCSNFGNFAFWGLRDNIRCSSWAQWKVCSYFLFVLNELFSLAVLVETLKAKMYRKSVFWKREGQYAPNFHAEGDVPTNNFCMDSYANECLTTLLPTVFTWKKLCIRLSSGSETLHGKWSFCVFEHPLGSFGATYDDHLRLNGKRGVNFLLVLVKLFSQVLRLRCYERISVENRQFHSNGGRLTQNFK